MKRIGLRSGASVLLLLFLVSAFVYPGATDQKDPSLSVAPLPLPGQEAEDFTLTAVVGDEIKQIRLFDYRGKWVYLTFIPAAFTFV